MNDFLTKTDAGVHLRAKYTQHPLGKKKKNYLFPTQSFYPDGQQLSMFSQDFSVSNSGWNHHAVNPLRLTRKKWESKAHVHYSAYNNLGGVRT